MGAYLEENGYITEAQSMVRYCGRTFPEIQINREGGSLFKRGQYSKAESKLKLALKENPSWAGLYLDLGMCQLKLGKHAEALKNLEIANGLNPYNEYTYNYLGEAYIQTGDTSRAISYWHKSIKGDVTVLEAYMSLGLFHLMKRHADSAMHYLSQIPDDKVTVNVYYWKGLAAFMLKDNAVALEYFNRYLSLGSDSSKIENINRVKKLLLERNIAP
jgi:tetratricopeptide (TPR) repeat protein